ncbi:MAG TPA: radical SAM protein [Desulfobacterales bacterium]|nr:radical SAM protein [Desulfobacterales bacterium]
MDRQMETGDDYRGFEQGPIRPPSEAGSLLIRVTRNCPWNRCSFCPVYKGAQFSMRPVAHVKRDIDMVKRYVDVLRENGGKSDDIRKIRSPYETQISDPGEQQALSAALHWFANGMKSVFIQDANSLIIRPTELIEILTHLKKAFPWAERITSYARSHTIVRIKDPDLKAMKNVGLNRIHIGLESASDAVLKMMKKGVTKATHIKAGLKVKAAGIELSEYVMPGLGGIKLSHVHATETADALNQINPEFIRLRTLAIPNNVPLFEEFAAGRFDKCTDLMMAKEILMFIEKLNGITSVVKSDHILNLFEDVEGTLPQDKDRMTTILRTFLDMDPKRQCVYQVGRRMGLFSRISDMENPFRLRKVEKTCHRLGITPDNVDEMVDQIMKRFI